MRIRSIRPADEIPNDNDPADVPPATVGPPASTPGDPHGVVITGEAGSGLPPPIVPSAWSGWPDEWATPAWGDGQVDTLSDTAWMCLDLNSSVLATMPPYLVGAADSTDASWTANPDPDMYTSWEEFAKQLFWDYQMGEVFVIATARYATGYPARFHVVPPWFVSVDWDINGLRSYMIGALDVTADLLHIRYKSTVHDLHGHGPLEVGAARLVADQTLLRYAQGFVNSGSVPVSILTHPEKLTAKQSQDLQAQWVAARQSALGEPAVLSGGVTHEAAQRRISPKDMALVELAQLTESRIAVLLGVPPYLVGLPSGADNSLVYSNASGLFDYHWRAGLRPKAQAVMAAISEWALPRGAAVEVNRDAYVQSDPYQRAQTYQILNGIVDQQGNPVLSVEEIRAAERFRVAGAAGLPSPEVTTVE
jgi:HK97 family phage portal protein